MRPVRPNAYVIGDGDWQHVIARRFAEERGLDAPGANEFYEAAIAGDALDQAGWLFIPPEV